MPKIGFPVTLSSRVEPLLRRPDERPVLRVLELRLGRRRQFRSGFRDLAKAQGATGRLVGDDALCRLTLGRGNIPSLRGGGDQHFPGRGARLAQVFLRAAHRPAAARRHVAPGALPPQIFVGRREFRAHLAPVAFELLGDQHRQRRRDPLPHLRAGDADDDRVVGLDDDPRVDLGRTLRGVGRTRCGSEGGSRVPARRPAQRRWRQTSGGSTCGICVMAISSASRRRPRCGSPRGSAHRCRSGRCW